MGWKVTALYVNGWFTCSIEYFDSKLKEYKVHYLNNTPDFVSWWLQVESANITIAVFFSLFSVWSFFKPRAVYCSSFHFLFLISSPSCLRGSRLLVRTFVLVLSMPGAYLQLFRSPRITRIRSAPFLSPYVSL